MTAVDLFVIITWTSQKASNFLYKFGNERDEDVEFKKPRCLSVDKAGHFMVRDFLNHTVQVLTLFALAINDLFAKDTK